jgi:heptaprenyl diphosphate synthase
MALGIAFQLSDDVMDISCSVAELGKEPGQDIREGVYTLPVLHALNEGHEAAELLALLSARPLGDRGVQRALEIIREGESLAWGMQAVRDAAAHSGNLARRLGPSDAALALARIADFVAFRCGAVGP